MLLYAGVSNVIFTEYPAPRGIPLGSMSSKQVCGDSVLARVRSHAILEGCLCSTAAFMIERFMHMVVGLCWHAWEILCCATFVELLGGTDSVIRHIMQISTSFLDC
jgi:hypothetical protein